MNIWILAICLLAAGALQADDMTPIKIGVPICMTGKYKEEAQALKDGYDLWAEMVNEDIANKGIKVGNATRGVTLMYVDDQSDPHINAEVTEKVLIQQNKVQFLFGSYSSEITAETAKVAKRYKIPVISAGGSADELFTKDGYVIGVLAPASRYLASTLELLKKNTSIKKVVLVYEESPFAKAVVQGAEPILQKLGIQIVQKISSPMYGAQVQVDPVAQVTAYTKTKELMKSLATADPDAFIGVGHFYDDERYLRAMEEVGLNPKALVLVVGPALPGYIEKYRERAVGTLLPTPWFHSLPFGIRPPDAIIGSAQSYAKRFDASHGYHPSYLNAVGTAAGVLLQKGIDRAKSLDPEKVRNSLRNLTIDCFYGTISTDDTGKNVGGSMVVVQIQKQPKGLEMVLVGPEKYAGKNKLIYPKPTWPKAKNGD